MKQDFLERAKDFFGKNEGINKVYFTSDGNMFRAESYADNWKISLGDKTVTLITREETEDKPQGDERGGETGGTAGSDTGQTGGKAADADEEKKALYRRYIELFDVKPVGLTVDKIKAKIEAKEAESK